MLDDFRRATLYKDGREEQITLKAQDKGQQAEVRHVCASVLEGGPPPIALDEFGSHYTHQRFGCSILSANANRLKFKAIHRLHRFLSMICVIGEWFSLLCVELRRSLVLTLSRSLGRSSRVLSIVDATIRVFGFPQPIDADGRRACLGHRRLAIIDTSPGGRRADVLG